MGQMLSSYLFIKQIYQNAVYRPILIEVKGQSVYLPIPLLNTKIILSFDLWNRFESIIT